MHFKLRTPPKTYKSYFQKNTKPKIYFIHHHHHFIPFILFPHKYKARLGLYGRRTEEKRLVLSLDARGDGAWYPPAAPLHNEARKTEFSVFHYTLFFDVRFFKDYKMYVDVVV